MYCLFAGGTLWLFNLRLFVFMYLICLVLAWLLSLVIVICFLVVAGF